MTLLKDRPTKDLELRREELLNQNKEYFNTGDIVKYSFNCRRIARIAAELGRRQNKE